MISFAPGEVNTERLVGHKKALDFLQSEKKLSRMILCLEGEPLQNKFLGGENCLQVSRAFFSESLLLGLTSLEKIETDKSLEFSCNGQNRSNFLCFLPSSL